VPASVARSEEPSVKKELIAFAGVARCKAPSEWLIEQADDAVNPSLRFSDGQNIIRVGLMGGPGSRYATAAEYLTGFAATTMGRPPEQLRIIKVAGIETCLYRHGYPVQLGDPHVLDTRAPMLAEAEFCLLPMKAKFVVLSWAREGPPNPTELGDETWKSFLDSFQLDNRR
jgi:hypothetical protein